MGILRLLALIRCCVWHTRRQSRVVMNWGALLDTNARSLPPCLGRSAWGPVLRLCGLPAIAIVWGARGHGCATPAGQVCLLAVRGSCRRRGKPLESHTQNTRTQTHTQHGTHTQSTPVTMIAGHPPRYASRSQAGHTGPCHMVLTSGLPSTGREATAVGVRCRAACCPALARVMSTLPSRIVNAAREERAAGGAGAAAAVVVVAGRACTPTKSPGQRASRLTAPSPSNASVP